MKRPCVSGIPVSNQGAWIGRRFGRSPVEFGKFSMGADITQASIHFTEIGDKRFEVCWFDECCLGFGLADRYGYFLNNPLNSFGIALLFFFRFCSSLAPVPM